MKKYTIEIKVNPFDEWKSYKKFNKKERALQSLETLKKNVPNLFKNTDYYKYRLFDRKLNSYSLKKTMASKKTHGGIREGSGRPKEPETTTHRFDINKQLRTELLKFYTITEINQVLYKTLVDLRCL